MTLATPTALKVTQLDCGHPATPRGIAAGYATDPVTDRTACYACTADIIRAQFRALETVTIYVQPWPGEREYHDARNRVQFTTWDGTVLGWGFGSIVGRWDTRRHYSGTIEGVRVHGWGPTQSGNYVTLRPYKGQ